MGIFKEIMIREFSRTGERHESKENIANTKYGWLKMLIFIHRLIHHRKRRNTRDFSENKNKNRQNWRDGDSRVIIRRYAKTDQSFLQSKFSNASYTCPSFHYPWHFFWKPKSDFLWFLKKKKKKVPFQRKLERSMKL